MLRPAIIFFSLLLFLPARANLGENVEQCVKRYGQPVGYSEANPKFPFGTVAFSSTGYTLIVFVLKNKEVGARVAKVDKSAFSDAELQNIINADANGMPWTTAVSTDPTCLQWSRADKATALYDKDKHIIVFTAAEMAEALRQGIPVPASKPAGAPAPAPVPAPAQAPAPVPAN